MTCQHVQFAVIPALDEKLGQLRAGDVIVIWKLDRMGRSLAHLVELVKRKVGRQRQRSDRHDLHSRAARLQPIRFACRVRTRVDPRADTGWTIGSQSSGPNRGTAEMPLFTSPATAMAAETLYREKRLSVSSIAGKLHISKSTLYGYLRHRRVNIGPYNKPAQVRTRDATAAADRLKHAIVLLSLRVENNSKFVAAKSASGKILRATSVTNTPQLRISPASTASRFPIARTRNSIKPCRICSSTSRSRQISGTASPNPTPGWKARSTGLVSGTFKSVHCSIAPQTPSVPEN